MSDLFEIVQEDTIETEVAPGVLIERRCFFKLSALAAAALAFDFEANAQSQTGQNSWDAFLKDTLPRAQELHKDASRAGQEAYLRWLEFNASRLVRNDLPSAKLGKFKDLEPASFFGVGYRGEPFFTVEWRMEPGAFLPPHCHPNVSVCTVGLDGGARIRNFEVVGDAPEFGSPNTFHVRETHNEIIGPGRCNTLSAVRDNIHTFQAGKEGARGVDITTYHGPNIGFSHLELNAKPVDEQMRVFEAVWKKI